MREHEYGEQKERGEPKEIRNVVLRTLVRHFGGYRARWVTDERKQIEGKDLLINTPEENITIDLKVREPGYRWTYQKELFIEIWSNREERKKSWLWGNEDYVFYTWKEDPTTLLPIGLLIPLGELHSFVSQRQHNYPHKTSTTPAEWMPKGYYTTEGIIIPLEDLQELSIERVEI